MLATQKLKATGGLDPNFYENGASQQLSFYQRQMLHQQKKEIKIKEQQYIKQLDEMHGCTFRPLISQPNHPDFSYVVGEERHH